MLLPKWALLEFCTQTGHVKGHRLSVKFCIVHSQPLCFESMFLSGSWRDVPDLPLRIFGNPRETVANLCQLELERHHSGTPSHQPGWIGWSSNHKVMLLPTTNSHFTSIPWTKSTKWSLKETMWMWEDYILSLGLCFFLWERRGCVRWPSILAMTLHMAWALTVVREER